MKCPSDLVVFKKADELVKTVYWLTNHFPSEEKFELVKQIRRAAVSVPSNLAEGCSRTSPKDFARFVEIALGSAMELEYQLGLARDLLSMGAFVAMKLDVLEVDRVVNQAVEVVKMLRSLHRHWQES